MFRKILIANRGEIAVRIIRACRELGIGTVAVYSEADRGALHVQLADEARLLGPPPPPESYLKIEAILDAAHSTGAEAVHPGYGFLAENAEFSRACAEAGIQFIGPGPDAISRMGDKLEARRSVEQLGVPLIPGTLGEKMSVDDLVTSSADIGFPVMVKAVGGGGGKGMRVVEKEEELRSSIETASSEAMKAFGNGEVYLERCLFDSRHVELQVVRDRHGNAVHLFERECSVQRRHQKLIEEAPALISEELRAEMCEAALAIVGGIDYESVGTIEFLVDGDRFFFLEMNTRLQVEHPVTELITGIDLVKLQIRIAAGEEIGFTQADVVRKGHAIEARICAESPESNFMPSFGRVNELQLPGGPGVRIDSDLQVGSEVTLYYDPLVAKIIASGTDRAEALDRMRFALSELRVGGIRTTTGLLERVVDDEEFRRGGYDTGYLARFLEANRGEPGDDELPAAIAAVLEHDARVSAPQVAADTPSGSETESGWIRAAREGALRRWGG